MKLYEGNRTDDGCVVTAGGRPLDPRLDLRNKSPAGFEWGYGGSGPGQLALALLADATGDDDLAERLHQKFKFEVVAMFERDRFLITQAEVTGLTHLNSASTQGERGGGSRCPSRRGGVCP